MCINILQHIFNRRVAESAEFFSRKMLESLRSLRLCGVLYPFVHYKILKLPQKTHTCTCSD